jgi:hypothetical protein
MNESKTGLLQRNRRLKMLRCMREVSKDREIEKGLQQIEK